MHNILLKRILIFHQSSEVPSIFRLLSMLGFPRGLSTFHKIITKGSYMKNKFTLSLLNALFVLAIGSSNAQAQSAFTGFYGQVSTGYESNQLGSFSSSTVTTPNANSNTIGTAPSQNFGGAPLVLGIGYYWQANDKWLIGVGADYSALSQTSATFSGSATNAPGNTTIVPGSTLTYNGQSMQLSNRLNLFVTPGYVIDKDKLVYLKAGYSQVTAQYNGTTSATRTLNGVSTTTAATGGSQSSNQGGYLIGLGYKQMITSGLYGFVEGNYMGYSAPSYSANTTTRANETLHGIGATGTRTATRNFASLNTFQALVGVGYAF
jgi:opacity protein-like surface antigen